MPDLLEAAQDLDAQPPGGPLEDDPHLVVALVDGADLAALPDDATSLRRWLDQARAVLADPDDAAPRSPT